MVAEAKDFLCRQKYDEEANRNQKVSGQRCVKRNVGPVEAVIKRGDDQHRDKSN
jgi:hypothetical protein